MKTTDRAEDYLKYIYILSKTQSVRGTRLAEMLGVSKPTVSVALKTLERDGYICMNEEREIFLTEVGRKIAAHTYEKNRAFENLLLKIGVQDTIAHEDACRMEHAVSAETFDALKKTVLDQYHAASNPESEMRFKYD